MSHSGPRVGNRAVAALEKEYGQQAFGDPSRSCRRRRLENLADCNYSLGLWRYTGSVKAISGVLMGRLAHGFQMCLVGHKRPSVYRSNERRAGVCGA